MNTDEMPPQKPFTNGQKWSAAIGATLLVVTEFMGAVLAFAWAVGGLLGIGEVGTLIFMAVVGIPGLMVSLMFTRRVLRVETRLQRIQTGDR